MSKTNINLQKNLTPNTYSNLLQKNKEDFVRQIAERIEEIVELDGEVSEEASLQITEDLLIKLDKDDKTLLFLKYVEDKEIKEIQQILNISEDLIKIKLKNSIETAIQAYIAFIETQS